jgi:hypothetical protein
MFDLFWMFFNEHSIKIQNLIKFEPHILHNWYFDSFNDQWKSYMILFLGIIGT